MNAQCESKRRRDRVELLCIVSVVLSNKQSLLAVEQKQAERARFGAACLHTLCRAFFLQNSFEIRWVAYLDNARTCFSSCLVVQTETLCTQRKFLLWLQFWPCGANGHTLHPAHRHACIPRGSRRAPVSRRCCVNSLSCCPALSICQCLLSDHRRPPTNLFFLEF